MQGIRYNVRRYGCRTGRETGSVIKAAFFDVDGTLLSFETHRMPVSTRAALTRLRERGILTIVSSGRPSYQLPPALADGFDAYVSLSGSLCYDARGVYHSVQIDPVDVRAIVEQARDGAFDVLVMMRDRAFVNALSDRVVATAQQAGLIYDLGHLDDAYRGPVYQFCAFLGEEDEHLVLDGTSSVKTTRWSHLFCDVVPIEGGKAAGVRATLERYGIAPDEAIAFGDGENDLSMFEAVGTSVAMGNAWDPVKDAATYVTDDVDHDGVAHMLAKLKLL